MMRTLLRVGRYRAHAVATPDITPSRRRSRTLLATAFSAVLVVGVAAELHVVNTPGGPTASAATVAQQPLVSGQTLSGTVNPGSLSALNAFGSMRGKANQVVTEYTATNTWANITNVTGEGLTGYLAGSSAHRVWSVPMLPLDNSSTLEAAAAGSYNADYYKIAQGLVAGGDGSATIRLGWELNGDWYPWSMSKDPSAFAQAWRNAVNQFRAVPGQHFTFDFNISPNYPDPTPAYPGDSYVDIISMDLYDYSWASSYAPTNHAAAWNGYLTEKTGLNWLANFANAHGKRMAFPEWAESYRCDGHGGGDDSYFIQQMYAWIKAHNVAYESYNNLNDDSCHVFAINSGYFPSALSAYKSAMGSVGSSAPAPAPTTTAPKTSAPTSAPATTSGALSVSSIRESSSPALTSSWVLNGTTNANTRYVFVQPPANTKQVSFYVDKATTATATHVENSAPYDLAGDGTSGANPFNMNSLSNGTHTLAVKVTLTNGTTETATATFYVN